MKQFFLNSCMKSIKKNCPEYNEEKLLEIRYGLEGIYLSITKCIVVFITTLILGIFKEMIIIMLLYTLLRTFGYGIHATKSWICLISSLTVFVIAPIMAINIVIPIYIKILLSGFCVSYFYLYAPSDTKKHPIIKKKRRKALKCLTVIISIIFTFLCLRIDNNFMSNAFLFAMLIEAVLVSPLTYKIFKLPYNNYKAYLANS